MRSGSHTHKKIDVADYCKETSYTVSLLEYIDLSLTHSLSINNWAINI